MGIKFYFITISIVLVICFLLLTYPMLYQLFSPSTNLTNTTQEVKIIVHRGASKLAPENTLSAISKALDLGADMIEIDVHLTKDGQLIVIHDELLERTTNGSGNVADYTLQELKGLDAGGWFSDEYKGEQLPTLEEVLALIKGNTTCLIEVKWNSNGLYDGIETQLIKDIRIAKATDWVIIQSFESTYLKNIHKIDTSITLGKLLIGSWQYPIPFYFDYQFNWGIYSPENHISWVNFYFKRATPTYIGTLKAKGVQVGVFTPNSRADLVKQINMGVDGVITDEPKLGKSLLSRK